MQKDIEKVKDAIRATIRIHPYVDGYLKEMPEIREDAALVRDIHLFFSEMFMEDVFYPYTDGLKSSEIFSLTEEVLSEFMPEHRWYVMGMLRQLIGPEDGE